MRIKATQMFGVSLTTRAVGRLRNALAEAKLGSLRDSEVSRASASSTSRSRWPLRRGSAAAQVAAVNGMASVALGPLATALLASVMVTAIAGLPPVAAAARAQEPDDARVSAQNVQFTPTMLTVAAGTTVTWTNDDPFQHSVTADDGSFDSGLFDPGQTFTFTFSTPGDYPYYCVPHGAPGGAGMSGTLTVQ